MSRGDLEAIFWDPKGAALPSGQRDCDSPVDCASPGAANLFPMGGAGEGAGWGIPDPLGHSLVSSMSPTPVIDPKPGGLPVWPSITTGDQDYGLAAAAPTVPEAASADARRHPSVSVWSPPPQNLPPLPPEKLRRRNKPTQMIA